MSHTKRAAGPRPAAGTGPAGATSDAGTTSDAGITSDAGTTSRAGTTGEDGTTSATSGGGSSDSVRSAPTGDPRPAPGRGRTIEDVAALAGVSRATVSRVLNGSSQVLPPTRARVLAAAAELGFVPSLAARALAGGRGDRVAIAAICHPGCPDEDRFFSTVAYAAAEEAGAAGLGVFVRRLTHAAALRELAADRALAGLIVINPSRDALAALPSSLLRRTVTLGACSPDVAAVDVDNQRASQVALGYLTALGRRRVTLVAGPGDLPCVRERTAVYLAHQADAGLPGRLVRAPLGVPAAAAALDASFTSGGPPEAIFAAGDGLAAAAVEVCRERGLRVGAEVAVVGFDDDPVPLSGRGAAYAAVRSPVPGIAASALRMVVSGDTGAEQRVLPPIEVGVTATHP